MENPQKQIIVKKLNGQCFVFTINSNINVAKFKQMISQKVNVPVKRQRLIYQGTDLIDENSINNFVTQNRATIFLVIKPLDKQEKLQSLRNQQQIDLSIGILNGQNINMKVHPKLTVGQIKQKISKQINVPISHEKLLFQGKQLKDNQQYLCEFEQIQLHFKLVIKNPQEQPKSSKVLGFLKKLNDGMNHQKENQ